MANIGSSSTGILARWQDYFKFGGLVAGRGRICYAGSIYIQGDLHFRQS